MIIDMAIQGTRKLEKPLFMVLADANSLEGEILRREAQQKYAAAGVPTFPTFREAARAAYHLAGYYKYLALRMI
jgi:acyl-CoA synthetase (NDP forming)